MKRFGKKAQMAQFRNPSTYCPYQATIFSYASQCVIVYFFFFKNKKSLLIQLQSDLQTCASDEKEIFPGAPREGGRHFLSEDAG